MSPRTLFESEAPNRNRLVRASAGTGKTYQLSNRYLELLFEGERPERILATTFTRKAAGEILTRILIRLAEAAASDERRAELAKAINRPRLTTAECREQLVKTLKQLHTLRVSTLDAFFMELAGSYALELGLPPGWTIAEEWKDEALRAEAINEVLNGEELQDLTTLFHLLTKGVAERGVAQLIQGLVNSIYNVFLEAPTDAWEKIPEYLRLRDEEIAELFDRLQSLPDPNHKGIRKSIDKDLQLITAKQWLELTKQGYGKYILAGNDEYCSRPIPDDIREIYEALLKHVRADLVTQLAKQTKATRDLLQHFDAAYEEQKQQQRSLRFDDVTRRLAAGSATNKNSLFRMNGRIDHLLLDEFQDTSFSQWQVLQPLARTAIKRKGGTFFCVGDTKQAIYGWRGGVAEIFDAIERDLPGIESQSLAESYRSSPIIMDVVNRVFTSIQHHPNLGNQAAAVSEWCSKFPVHKTARQDYPGYAAIHVSKDADNDDKDEKHYGYAAELIASLVQESPGRSVGVLCRKNAVVAQMIYRLRKLGIAASEEGGNSLTDSAPVEAILSLLHLLDHPSDSVCRFHVEHSPLGPLVGIGPQETQPQLEAIAQRLRREIAFRGLGPVCLDWGRQLAVVCNERDRNRVQQLVELAYGYPAATSLRMTDFVEFIRTKKVPDPAAVDVRVMTIHQAKGLEFEIVVLPELEEDLHNPTPEFVTHRPSPSEPIDVVCRFINQEAQRLLPDHLQQLFEDHRSEEIDGILCVLYVALTRASHALHMVLQPSKENERNLGKTISGLLRSALLEGGPLVPDTVPFECGDRDWHHHAAREPNETDELEQPTSSARITLQPPRKDRSRGWQRVAPSQLEGGARVEWQTLFGVAHGGDFSRGTLFHAWFELVEWLDVRLPTKSELLAAAEKIAAEIGPLADQLETLAEQFLRMLERPKLKSLLHRSFYEKPPSTANRGGYQSLFPQTTLRVEREFPFALRQGDELLQGAIDRLVLTEDEEGPLTAEIIDFKTDAIPAGDATALAAKVAFYRPQLQAYRKAVAELFQLAPERVTARLMFVGCDQCVKIDS